MSEPSFETPLVPELERFESAATSQKEELDRIAETSLQQEVASIIEMGSQAILQ